MRRCAFEGKTLDTSQDDGERAAGRVRIAWAAGSDEADAGSTRIRTWRALNTAERGYSQQYATATPDVHVRLD